jgi:2-oxoglutarate dehydrogenase E1 component
VVLCSGQLYYDLLEAREKKQANNVALIRVEQIYPFPAAEVKDVIARYPVNAEIAWAQEEPRNMGAWTFIRDQMGAAVKYIGRAESASTAAGSLKRHQQEQAEIIEEAFAAESKPGPKKRGRKR